MSSSCVIEEIKIKILLHAYNLVKTRNSNYILAHKLTKNKIYASFSRKFVMFRCIVYKLHDFRRPRITRMTVEYVQEIQRPALYIKQAIIHQCLFLLPLLCVIMGLGVLEWKSPENLPQYFKQIRQSVPVLAEIMRSVTKYSSVVLLVFYAFQIWKQYRKKQFAELRFLAASLVVYYTLLSLTLYALKIGIGAPRPYADTNNYAPFSLNPDYHSFPSGHTAECSAISSTLAHYFRTYSATFILGCILGLVAFSRVFIGMHHPIDLLPGALLGSLAPLLAATLVHKKFWRKLPFSHLFAHKAINGLR